jgi:uncharacterized protein
MTRRTRTARLWFALLAGAWWLCFAPLAAAAVAIPPLQQRVTDLAGVLAPSERQQLEHRLAAFEAKKGTQIAVLVLPSTRPETIEQYSIRLAEAWQVGRRKVDDGAILVVALEDRALRLEVGYGLEGALPDAVARRIVSDVIAPHFREGRFAAGIDAGVTQILRVVDGEPLPPPQPARDAGAAGDIAGLLEMLLVIGMIAIVVLGGILRALLGRLPAALAVGGIVGAIAWLLVASAIAGVLAGALAFGLTLAGVNANSLANARGGRAGGWGGGWGGGGWSSGGGSWGGGGGGFGGGGASGRW